jgi:CubicO group peptidase (beta-lactamase class C family)
MSMSSCSARVASALTAAVAAVLLGAGTVPAQIPPGRGPAARLAAQAAPLAGLDAYITQAMRDWDVPGLAIAVVKDDSVVYARGFGVRERGKPDAVSVNTVYIEIGRAHD